MISMFGVILIPPLLLRDESVYPN